MEYIKFQHQVSMKFELILLTALFFYPFDNFGQLDSNLITLDSAVIKTYKESQPSVFSIGDCQPTDSSSIIRKKNGNRLVECYNKETQIIKTRRLIKTPITKRWDEKGRITIWDENGKKYAAYSYRKKYISDPFAIRNSLQEIRSIRWYFIDKGKLCLKRKKSIQRVIHATS